MPHLGEGEEGHKVAAVRGHDDHDEEPPEAHHQPAAVCVGEDGAALWKVSTCQLTQVI